MKNKAYLALGSNMGNRESYLHKAVNTIDKNELCRVVKLSSVYETRPYGYTEQENFLNSVIEIETDMNVAELFEFIKTVENKIGRQERFKWGPREIDIDILLYNSEIINSENIRIPHKGIADRDFVLVPLNEIAPDLIHPELNKKISDICKLITENNIIRKF